MNGSDSKKYYVYEWFIKEYESVQQATKENNFKNHSNIIANLKGRTKHAYGYVWKYKQ